VVFAVCKRFDPQRRIVLSPADEEIAAYEAHWPIGTRERTAFALLIFTGQRLADVARMSWRDIEGAGIQVVQGKTRARLWIPLHPELAEILDRWPRAHVSILTTNFGKPFTTKGFGNWMDQAGGAARPLRDAWFAQGRRASTRRLWMQHAPDHGRQTWRRPSANADCCLKRVRLMQEV
jgi:integrase